MQRIDNAVQSLVSLVGAWKPKDVPRVLTMYYSSAQFRGWITRARGILNDRSSIPISVRHELQTLDTSLIEAVIDQLAMKTEGLTPDEEKIVCIGREDLTAAIMADYILIAYGDHLASVGGGASVQACVDAMAEMLTVSSSTGSVLKYECIFDTYGYNLWSIRRIYSWQ